MGGGEWWGGAGVGGSGAEGGGVKAVGYRSVASRRRDARRQQACCLSGLHYKLHVLFVGHCPWAYHLGLSSTQSPNSPRLRLHGAELPRLFLAGREKSATGDGLQFGSHALASSRSAL